MESGEPPTRGIGYWKHFIALQSIENAIWPNWIGGVAFTRTSERTRNRSVDIYDNGCAADAGIDIGDCHSLHKEVGGY